MSRNVELSMSYHLCTTYNRLMEIARKIKDGAKQKKKKDKNQTRYQLERNLTFKKHTKWFKYLKINGRAFNLFRKVLPFVCLESATDLNVESCSFVTSGAKGKITSGA